jgi:hypothetical protein
VSDKVLRRAAAPRNFSRAVALIDRMQEQGRLNEIAIAGFAGDGKYEEMVAGLARICTAPIELIEKLMQNPRYDGVLVACKAAEFRWPTLNAILKARFARSEMTANDLIQVRADFIKLSVATARRMFRFWLVRGVAKSES